MNESIHVCACIDVCFFHLVTGIRFNYVLLESVSICLLLLMLFSFGQFRYVFDVLVSPNFMSIFYIIFFYRIMCINISSFHQEELVSQD